MLPSRGSMQLWGLVLVLIAIGCSRADEHKPACENIRLSLHAGQSRYTAAEVVGLQLVLANEGTKDCLVGPVWIEMSGGTVGYRLEIRNLSKATEPTNDSFSHGTVYGLKEIPIDKLLSKHWKALGSGELQGILQRFPPGMLQKGKYQIRAVVWDSTLSQLSQNQIKELNFRNIQVLDGILESNVVDVTVE